MARRKAAPEAPKPLAPPASLLKDAWTYGQFGQALLFLAKQIPQRTSLRQTLAFIFVVEKISMGHEVVVADLADIAGDDVNGQPVFGQSINRSHQLLLAPTERDPDGLDWLYTEPDPSDARRKILRLTPKGMEVAQRVAKILKERDR